MNLSIIIQNSLLFRLKISRKLRKKYFTLTSKEKGIERVNFILFNIYLKNLKNIYSQILLISNEIE